METNDVSYGIQKIYNNFLENIYYTIYFQVKNQKDTLAIIQHAVEKVLLFDLNCEGIITLKERLLNSIFSQIEEYLKKQSSENNLDELCMSIPSQLYLYNFNLFQFLNIQDNLIFINAFYKKNDLNNDKIKRCNEIISLMSRIYVNRIKVKN